ncbi:MAG: iron-containing alcohol dehydrogenase, partial [Bacilli bacterium]
MLFTKYNPTVLLFGKGQIQALPAQLADAKRVLLVYGGGSIHRNGVYADVTAQLKEANIAYVELGGVEPNPRLTTVEKGIALCRAEGVDWVLAVGGGSVIDCAKAISVGAANDAPIWSIITKQATATGALPLGTVLTLAATGSEMNANSVITNMDTEEKLGWSSPYAFPKFSILDPTYTYSVPRDQTVYGIVDTMSHALEQYFHAGGHTPLTDRMTEGLLQTVMEAAPIVLDNPNDADARETLLYAGTLALNGTLAPGIGGGDWSTHRLEHAVSALYDIPHAGGLAILFPAWLRFVSQKRPERVAELGWRVFGI